MIFLIAIILLIILIIPFLFKSADYKGKAGESQVASQLYKLNQNEYTILNDVLIQTSRGSSQIDHVVVSKYGIFVIETKNYRGWIHGHENSEHWTQTFYKSKYQLVNPVKQNWAHIYALKEVLSDFKGITFFPIVVFVGSGELKNVTTATPVIYKHQLETVIKSISKQHDICIDNLEKVVNRINQARIHEKHADVEHIYNVNNTLYIREKKKQLLICPRCGGRLIKRNGKYGRFYGCSNYPNCKYTQK